MAEEISLSVTIGGLDVSDKIAYAQGGLR